ncbi:TonB-dependent receptor [Sphingomonas solaris]|uniref:TonB-dependent receptor n=1 Tax=Alterirhizorhabdus solaris TaxID=2529389 RepID=A0A558RBG3_9SPHN|nr:TonB-dependent receptor [Sphingomonas solaris]TVV76739.1 TonB-dependent receptor [Sphingomonas solaris]
MKTIRTCLMVGTALTAATIVPALAHAQTADAQSVTEQPLATEATPQANGGLEEIVVTAQKREQRLQDVPVAITAISEATIQANRITSVQDLSGLAPNVIVRPAAGGSAIPTFSMRGLTSYGVVPGSDKQVSINLDGVYLSATRGALFELPDIARIEVLRGPQGTLFGRNATAGAVSIVTKDPDGELGARMEVGYGNYNQKRIRASLDLPQFGPFSGYVSFVHNEREGDIRNLGAGTRWDRSGVGTLNGQTFDTNLGVQYSPKRLGNKNVETYFAALKFEPSDTFRAVYKFDMSIDNSSPEGVGVTAINRDVLTSGGIGPIFAAFLDNQPAGGGPFGPAVISGARRPKAVNNFYTTPSYLKNQGHSLTATFDAADNFSIKNIAAYRKSVLNPAVSEIGGLGGLVVTPAVQAALNTALINGSAAFLIPGYNSLSPAVQAGARAAVVNSYGPVGSRFVDVGTNIQNKSEQWSDEVQLNLNLEPATLTAGGIYFHSKDRSGVPQFTRGTANLTAFPSTGEVALGTATGVGYNKATSIAGFAQAEVHVTPVIDVVLGGRLTHDRKSGRFQSGINFLTGVASGAYTSTVPGCTAPVFASNPIGVCRTAGNYTLPAASTFTYRDTRFIYSAGVNYKPSNDILVYAKYSTGYVSGGAIGGLPFKPETVKSLEGGLKADFLDRKLRTNLALFIAKYKDVQSSQSGRNIIDTNLTPPRARNDLGTAIITGFDETAKGFEFELTAVPVEGLTLTGSLGYTDINQKNYNPLLLTSAIVPGQTLANVNFQPTGTPKWTSNLSAQYITPPVFGNATVLARIDAQWRSKLVNDPNADRATLIPIYADIVSLPSQWLLNSRVALRDIDFGDVSAELAVWGRNLTNDKKALYPLILAFSTGTSYQAARTYGLELIVKY